MDFDLARYMFLGVTAVISKIFRDSFERVPVTIFQESARDNFRKIVQDI